MTVEDVWLGEETGSLELRKINSMSAIAISVEWVRYDDTHK